MSGRVVLSIVDPASAEARACLAAYYAELNRRFATGFEVSRSRDPDRTAMMPPLGAFLLAMDGPRAVGCAGLKGAQDGLAEVKRVWIAPEARGRGLATRLMAGIEAQARALGLNRLVLDTNAALPEAAALYRKLGWTEIERFNDDPYAELFFEKRL